MNETTVDTLHNVKRIPEFASLCSFIALFGEDLTITLSYPQLIRCLQLNDNENIPKFWIDLHRKLLSKIRYTCSFDKWEIKLKKFIFNFMPRVDDYLFEYNSYLLLKPIERVQILNLLFDSQFDRNTKFKENVNTKHIKTLRNLPFGSDIYGILYWFFLDSEKNILFYKENLEEESFELIAENTDELTAIETELKNVEIENIDLSVLYKYPEETDSPLVEFINDLDKSKHASPVENEMKLCQVNDDKLLENEKIITNKLEIDIKEEIDDIVVKGDLIIDESKQNTGDLIIKKNTIYTNMISGEVKIENECTDNDKIEKESIDLKVNKISNDFKNGINKDINEKVDNENELKIDNIKYGKVETGKESKMDLSEGKVDEVNESKSNNIKNVDISEEKIEKGNELKMDIDLSKGKVDKENESKSDNIKNVDLSEEKIEKGNKSKMNIDGKVDEETESKSDNIKNFDLSEEKIEKGNESKMDIDLSEGKVDKENKSKSENIKDINIREEKVVKKKGRKFKNEKDQSKSEENVELRRSSRQRKPVTLFTIEHSNRDLQQLNSSEEDEDDDANKRKKSPKKMKKTDQEKTEKSIKKKKKLKNSDDNIKKKKGNKKNKLQKKLNGKNKMKKNLKPWEINEESDDGDNDENLDDHDIESVENDSVDLLKDDIWANDKPESDFDENKLSETSDEETLRSRGRNYCRQKKRQKKQIQKVENNNDDDDNDVSICQICLSSKLPEMMLLCDECDLGHHAMCLRPPLMLVPEGDWYCPKCCHRQLLAKITEIIPKIISERNALLAKSRMQERLNFVNISMSNIISSSGASKKKNVTNEPEDDDEEDDDNSDDDDDDDDDSSEDDEDDDETNESHSSNSKRKPYKFRESSRKEIHKYNFEELDKIFDEALVYDEKYQWKKKHQQNDVDEIKNENIDDENQNLDVDDDDDDEDEKIKNKNSDSEYDYSELVPRKKSSGKDMSNLLRDSDDDNDDDGDDKSKNDENKSEDGSKNGSDNKVAKEDGEDVDSKIRPKIVRASTKKRRNSFSSSDDDVGQEDMKDEDFRLSDEECGDIYSEEDVLLEQSEDIDDGDLSDEWIGRKKPKRRSTRNMGNRKNRNTGRSKKKTRGGIKSSSNLKSTNVSSVNNKLARSDKAKLKNMAIQEAYDSRPRRRAARQVNYRELVGEDENELEEYYEEPDLELKPTKSRRKRLEKIEKDDEIIEKSSSRCASKSPEFDPTDDDEEEEGKEVVKTKTTTKASSYIHLDKPPPVVNRNKHKIQERPKLLRNKSDSEYEESFHSSADEDEEDYDNEDEGEENKESEEDAQSDETDKLEYDKIPSPISEELKESICTEPPIKKQKCESSENPTTNVSEKLNTMITNGNNSTKSEEIEDKEIGAQLNIQTPIKNVPIEPLDVGIKNPMRADATQDDDVEDDVDSESEFIMTSVKR